MPIFTFLLGKRTTLRHLRLGIMDSVALDTFMSVITPECFGELETMDIWARGDTAAFSKHVATFPKLKHLNLAKCHQINSLERALTEKTSITHLALPQIQSPLEFRFTGDIGRWTMSMSSLRVLRMSPLYLMRSTQPVRLELDTLELETFQSNSIDQNASLQLDCASNIRHIKLSFLGLETKYNRLLVSYIKANRHLKKITCAYSEEIVAALQSPDSSIESIDFLYMPRRMAPVMEMLNKCPSLNRINIPPVCVIDSVVQQYGSFQHCPNSKLYHYFRVVDSNTNNNVCCA
ncbi:hypothetical protein SAMD00019534_023130 [Acytostelium subglobosum LB1]|uniref:hypothetical protein n=1 Tax=Acytostelium subglobosum LB1 TaxID=1410327 RepID=UPI000645086A|nr:hypothetical protein SAMD00019534_023130 [Acytostelium subglobosum LB1]GAM19138.1 hypothetical protein SAMD00019534_023130 [Acytostelium subglobosum LB1]|eukprot:XP_012757065.1 hypothetical protein SAMD00019534_023130 [Acytostelium subglobosum LB1]